MTTLRAWVFKRRPTELRYSPPSEARQHIPLPSFERCDKFSYKCVDVASIYRHRLTAGLNSRMKRPTHKFKIGCWPGLRLSGRNWDCGWPVLS